MGAESPEHIQRSDASALAGDVSPDQLGFAMLASIRRILRRVSEHSRALSGETGLTVPQLLVCKAIHEAEIDEITLAWVAKEVQLSPSTVSGVLDRLERAGVVLRARSERDRRRVLLTLTPEGATRINAAPPPLQEKFLERFSELKAGEQASLLAALEQVVEMMDASELDVSPVLAAATPLVSPS